MDGDEVIQHMRQTRYGTMALADQIGDDQWGSPLLPGERRIQDVLTHIIAWDEWAIGVLDISRVRDELPQGLVNALRDVDAYNGRAVARYSGLTRDDVLSALQSASDRLLKSVFDAGPHWQERELPALPWGNGEMRPVNVTRMLRFLDRHEAAHHAEIESAFAIRIPPAEGDNGQAGESDGA